MSIVIQSACMISNHSCLKLVEGFDFKSVPVYYTKMILLFTAQVSVCFFFSPIQYTAPELFVHYSILLAHKTIHE